jgi:hypothetical protein
MSLLISCKKIEIPEKVNTVLELAGDNKNELLKTIYYFDNTGDSLKLKAAYFLIENLENKYSYAGESYRRLQRVIESSSSDVIENTDSLKQYGKKIDKKLSAFNNIEFSLIADAKYIKSNYLIRHINNSFRMLQMPWIKGKISFDQFCRYILPYKIGYEPIENWHESVLQDFQWIMDSLYKANASLLDAAKIINKEIAGRFKPRGLASYSMNFGYDDLKRIKYGSCYNAAVFTMYIMRALGIPISMDFAPIWGNRNGDHQWTVIHLPDGKIVPFDPTYDFDSFYDRFKPLIHRTVIPPKYAVTTKIYRIQFDIEENKHSGQKHIPSLSKQNIIDVTDQYTSTSNISMQLHHVPSNVNYAYLFVFDIPDWTPVQISSISSDSTVSFNTMGKGVVYLPAFLSSNNLLPFDYPFIQNERGKMRKFIPKKKMVNITIRRKYPYLERIISYADRMRGGIFQVSNSPKFANPKVLYTITKTPEPYYQEVVLKNKDAYRYFRYLSPDSCYGDVAEIEVYSSLSNEPLYGKFIGIRGEGETSIQKVFDKDKLTYYTSMKPNGNWFGIDFGKKIKINRIKYFPRNDQNTVEPGDDYELVYWDNEWISLGVQKANKYYLKYTAPENALLWLRNLTKGNEERIFTYENGKQVWR